MYYKRACLLFECSHVDAVWKVEWEMADVNWLEKDIGLIFFSFVRNWLYFTLIGNLPIVTIVIRFG